MSGDRFKRRLRSVGPLRAALACTLSLLVITSGSLVFVSTAQEVPDGVDDGATFTVETGAIFPHLFEGGQICAEKIESDVNKVTITDSTLKDVKIYLGDEGEVQTEMSFPKGTVDGKLVIYTNGENVLIDTLASLGVCLPPGIPNPLPTTIEAYWLGAEHLETTNLEVTSGGDVPEAGGPTLNRVLNETNTSKAELEPINPNNTTTNNTSTNTTTATQTATPTTNTTATQTATPTTDTTATQTATPTTDTTATQTATPTTNTTATPTTNTTATQTATPATDTTATQTATQTTNATTEAKMQDFGEQTPVVSQTASESTPDQSPTGTLTTVAGTPPTTETTTTQTETDDGDGGLLGILSGLFG